MKDRSQKITLANMCMIENNEDVLVLNRQNKNWKGLVFPGGHVEKGESFVESTIREVKEETGLTISNLKLCGVKQYPITDNIDDGIYVVFLFKTKTWSGTLQSSEEGDVFWVKKKDLIHLDIAKGMDLMLQVFDGEYSEHVIFYDNEWVEKLY